MHQKFRERLKLRKAELQLDIDESLWNLEAARKVLASQETIKTLKQEIYKARNSYELFCEKIKNGE